MSSGGAGLWSIDESLTLTERACRNDVNHNIARHGSVGTLDVKRVSAVELVAELRAVGVPMSATRLSTSLSEKQR